MPGPGRPAYNRVMNPPENTPNAFLDALVCRDFDRLARTISPDATMRALVPPGHLDWAGRDELAGRFAFWFGGTPDIELLHCASDDVAGRAMLTWRFRLRQDRLGDGWHVIAQHAFCDLGPDGLIERIDLLCSGFVPEAREPGAATEAGARILTEVPA
jgi:hypothetical protein